MKETDEMIPGEISFLRSLRKFLLLGETLLLLFDKSKFHELSRLGNICGISGGQVMYKPYTCKKQ